MSRYFTTSYVISTSDNKWLGNVNGALTLVPGSATPPTVYPLNVIWTALVDPSDNTIRQLVNVDSRGSISYLIPNSTRLSSTPNGGVMVLTLNPGQFSIMGSLNSKAYTLTSKLVWTESTSSPDRWASLRSVDTPPMSFLPLPYTLLTRPTIGNGILLPVKTYIIKFGDKVLARQNTSLVLIPAPSQITLNVCWTTLIGGNNALVNIDTNGTLYYVQAGSLTLTTEPKTSYASLSPQGLNIVGYLSPSPNLAMLSVNAYSQLSWHMIKPVSPNCVEIVDPNTKCLPGLYQIQIGNTCLQSDLSFGICSSSPFSDTNKNVWFYDGDQLFSWKEDAWSKNTVQLYIRNGRVGITPAVCDTSINCAVDPAITSSMRKGFVLTNSWLHNLQFDGLCIDLKTLTFKPFISTYSFTLTDFSAHARAITNDIYKTGNPNYGSPTTSIGAVICNRTPPSRSSISYNASNLSGCCNGKYTKMGKQLLPPIFRMRDNIPDKNNYVIAINSKNMNTRDYTYTGNYLQVNRTGTYYKITGSYFRPNGDVTVSLDKSVDYDADNDTIYLFADKLMIDGDICDRDWCPWSNTCRTIAPTPPTTEYCSQMDVNGSPLLNTDVNCVSWCGSQPTPYAGACGTASSQFCALYPKHPACACQNFIKTDAWKNMSALFQAVPNCPDCSYVIRPECWAMPCTSGASDPNRALKTSEQLSQACPATTVNICSQILNVQQTGGNVRIDNNVFEQVCGQPLPAPTPPQPNPAPPNPQPTPQPTPAPPNPQPTPPQPNPAPPNPQPTPPQPSPPNPQPTPPQPSPPNPQPTPPQPSPPQPSPPQPTPAPVTCIYGDWGEYGTCTNNLQSRARALKSGPSTCQSVEIQSQTCITPSPDSDSTSKTNTKQMIYISAGIGIFVLLLLIGIKFFKPSPPSQK